MFPAMAQHPPPPGSPEAQAAGCICPVLDNAHGKGYLGGVTDDDGEKVYVTVGGCPIHDPERLLA